MGSYYLYIEIENYKFSKKNVTKWQHWRHFRNVCFLGGPPRHGAHRLQNLIWNKINFFFLISRFQKTCFEKNAFKVLRSLRSGLAGSVKGLEISMKSISNTYKSFVFYSTSFKEFLKLIKKKSIFWNFYSDVTP